MLSGASEAGYIFKPSSDTVRWIDEMDAMYPKGFKIQWVTDDIFLSVDFKSTEAGVIRTSLNKVIYYGDGKLTLVEYPTGNCYVEPDKNVHYENDTLYFEKYNENDVR